LLSVTRRVQQILAEFLRKLLRMRDLSSQPTLAQRLEKESVSEKNLLSRKAIKK
jgi:hypothetical protein